MGSEALDYFRQKLGAAPAPPPPTSHNTDSAAAAPPDTTVLDHFKATLAPAAPESTRTPPKVAARPAGGSGGLDLAGVLKLAAQPWRDAASAVTGAVGAGLGAVGSGFRAAELGVDRMMDPSVHSDEPSTSAEALMSGLGLPGGPAGSELARALEGLPHLMAARGAGKAVAAAKVAPEVKAAPKSAVPEWAKRENVSREALAGLPSGGPEATALEMQPYTDKFASAYRLSDPFTVGERLPKGGPLESELPATLTASRRGGDYEVHWSHVPEHARRTGVATRLYQRAAAEAEQRGGKLVSSDDMSPDVTRLWDSLVGSGKAVRRADGRYEMKAASKVPDTIPAQPGMKPRGFVETVKKSAVTSPEVRSAVQGEYTPIVLKDLAEKATAFVRDNFEESLHIARTADNTAETNAIAQAAIVRLQQLGRHGDAVDIVQRVAEGATRQGQANAALAIYGRLDPAGVLRFALNTFERANKARPNLNLRLTPKLAELLGEQARALQALPEGRERTLATAKMLSTIADQVPASLWKKVSTIQTFSQLLNPKTLVRNLGGNVGFAAAENVSDVIGTGIDKAVSLVTRQRTQTLPSLRTQARGAATGLREGMEDASLGVNTSPGNTQFDLPQGRVFKGGVGGAAERALNVSLRVPDRAAWQAAFDESVRNQKLATIRSGKTITPELEGVIHDRALYDAAYRTFQDDNVVTHVFSGLKKALNAGKEFGLGDLVLKYPKTPGSILARGIEYSPAGFIKSTLELARPLFGGKFNQREFVRSASRATTGTVGGVGVGAMLHRLGIITGREEDKKARDLQRETGLGDYRVNISALKRFVTSGFSPKAAKLRDGDTMVSYDWFQPGAISLSMGANIDENAGQFGGLLGTIASSASGGVETLAAQPLVQGVQKLFRGQKLTDSLIQTATGAPASFVPTLLSQIRQLYDNASRVTQDDNPLTEATNMVKNKLPIVSKSLPQRVGVLGSDLEMYQGKGNNPFNVFFNPAFLSKYKDSPEVRAMDEAGFYPSASAPSFKVGKGSVKLKPKDESDFRREVGLAGLEAIRGTISNPGYQELDQEVKRDQLDRSWSRAVSVVRKRWKAKLKESN